MTDDMKIGRARFDAYQLTNPQVESAGDAPDLRYITGAELERLRTRLQRAEELLQESRLSVSWKARMDESPLDERLLQNIDAFLGERHD